MKRLAVLALAALAIPLAALADTCPDNTIRLYSEASYTTPSEDHASNGRRAAYDLVAGWLEIAHPGDLGTMFCETVDRYRVTGVPDGTPLHLTARLDVDGFSESNYVPGSGQFTAEIESNGASSRDSVVAWSIIGHVPLQKSLTVELDVPAGAWFDVRSRLTYYRSPGGAQFGGGRAMIRFDGLPAGADVVSCQGYQLTVPAGGMSWGKLKTIYR